MTGLQDFLPAKNKHVCGKCRFCVKIKDSDNIVCDGGFSTKVEICGLGQEIECEFWEGRGKK